MSEQDEKLCPFRQWVAMDRIPSTTFQLFGPCLREKCAMWRTWETNVAWGVRENAEGKPKITEYHNIVGFCGLAGKP